MSPPSPAKKSAAKPQRSPCPIACSLDLFGDKWTLLIIRDLMLGKTSFKDFATAPEGIPTNILSERLERLTQAELVKRTTMEHDGRRLTYQLTAKGKDLKKVMFAMRDWGSAWIEGTVTKRN